MLQHASNRLEVPMNWLGIVTWGQDAAPEAVDNAIPANDRCSGLDDLLLELALALASASASASARKLTEVYRSFASYMQLNYPANSSAPLR